MESEAVAEAGPREPATARLTRNFLIIALALLLVKLLLVSRREILTDQYDAEAYVSASLDDLRSVFGGDQFHPPGASLVMALARLLGIPYRIFIEIFLAAAAFFFLQTAGCLDAARDNRRHPALRPLALPSRPGP
jgi:hypothetical protein